MTGPSRVPPLPEDSAEFRGRSRCESIAVRIKKNVCNKKAYAGVKEQLRKHRLQARAVFLPDKDIAATEQALLEEYRSKYGELPPFNAIRSAQKIAGPKQEE